MITDHMIIKASGQYDKEVIQRLRLENLGLQRITNLESCFVLMDLCLSHNEISAIAGLEQLVALKRLDLSFNKIRKIERLQDLLSLEYLDLRANSISSVNDLDELQQLPALQSLFLQGNDGEDTNPGGHLNITEAFSSLEEHLKLLQPSGEDNKTPPTVPWLDGLLDADSTGPGSAFEIPASDDDIDHIANNSKQLKPVTEAHQQITDMMNEECAHLLRKAQSAVSKATLSN